MDRSCTSSGNSLPFPGQAKALSAPSTLTTEPFIFNSIFYFYFLKRRGKKYIYTAAIDWESRMNARRQFTRVLPIPDYLPLYVYISASHWICKQDIYHVYLLLVEIARGEVETGPLCSFTHSHSSHAIRNSSSIISFSVCIVWQMDCVIGNICSRSVLLMPKDVFCRCTTVLSRAKCRQAGKRGLIWCTSFSKREWGSRGIIY